VIRRQEITPENLRAIAVGNTTVVKLNYAPAEEPKPAPAPPPAPGHSQAAAPTTPAPGMPVATVPAAGTAPAPTGTPVAPALTPPATAPPAGNPPATAPAPGADGKPAARVRFSPSQVEAAQSGTFSVSLMLEGGADVAAAPLEVQFDPKILRLNSVARGDFFSSDGQQPLFTWNIHDSGSATIQLNRPQGAPGANGSGVLVTLNFQAIGKGPATVSIPNLSVRSTQGQVLASGSPQVTVNVK
jgi:hypothetical protein